MKIQDIPSPYSIADKIYACWLGKAIGGTLGGPWEGQAGPLSVHFYDPIPTGLLPNDDLDLQLVWAHHLLQTGAKKVTPELMAEAWEKYVDFPMDEYGIFRRNRAYGLAGPAVGEFDNWFGECMGAIIRSEIWACVAPGEPRKAAGMAWADAVCDHSGDGVWAEVFFAALQSAAFTETDPDRLLDGSLALLPEASRVRLAVQDTRQWWKEEGDWDRTRLRIMERHARENFTDVAANMAFTILGWLAGEGDFGRSICLANNCGEDTDCTAATLGALLGILDPGCIPAEWRAPIGEEIKVSPEIVNFAPPRTLRELTDWTLRIREQLGPDQPDVLTPTRCLPATTEASPLRIPTEIAMASDASVWERSEAPSVERARPFELSGHWLRDEGQYGTGAIMLLRVPFVIEEGQEPMLMAFSYARTAVWIDGRRVDSRTPYRTGRSSAGPSFHRNKVSFGSFDARPFHPGKHEAVIAWDRSSGNPAWNDLIVGVGDWTTRFWYPFAMARRHQA